MSTTNVLLRWRVIASTTILVVAAVTWLLGNRIATVQPVSVAFRPVAGSAEVEFLPQPWANSPICSCHGGWRGVGLPADQFDLNVGDGDGPWSLMVGPLNHTVPANWWFNPRDDFLSSFSLTVTQGDRLIEKVKAPAGITIESSGAPVGVFTKESSFSSILPAEGSTTSLRSEPMMMDGSAAGISSIVVKAPEVSESASDFTADGEYIGAYANEGADVTGSNFRSTMIDTLGPHIDLTLGPLPNVDAPAGTYRLWVGDREVTLPRSGEVRVSIRTDLAVRFRPLPLNHSQVLGTTKAGNDLVLPQVTQKIPTYETTLTNAFGYGGDSWDRFVKRAESKGPPIELPDTPSIFVYGNLSRVQSSAVQGTVSSSSGTEISPGDQLELTSKKGFDFTIEPLALVAATTEPISESQYLHGQARGSVKRSEGPSGLDGFVERLRGDSITRTQWLIRVTPFIAAFAGFFTIREAIDAVTRARSATTQSNLGNGGPYPNKRNSPTSDPKSSRAVTRSKPRSRRPSKRRRKRK